MWYKTEFDHKGTLDYNLVGIVTALEFRVEKWKPFIE